VNFYKHHIGDYSKKTAHLSLVEHGAYLLLLHHYYATEEPLPADTKMLARILRADTPAERKAIEYVLKEFWLATDAGWINSRAQDEIERASHQRAVNRELGKRGGRPPKHQAETESETEPETESVSEQKANRNPIQTPDSRLQTKPSPRPTREPVFIPLPEWLPASEWDDFLAHRKAMKAAMTPEAQRRAIAQLERLRADGHEPLDVLNQSIVCGWKGLFPVENHGAPNGTRRESSAERHERANAIHEQALARAAEELGRGLRGADAPDVPRGVDLQVVHSR
jgi:uncharacterized protein YdaU (DUF1376 family)